MNLVDQWESLDPNVIYPKGIALNQDNIYFLQSRNAQGQFLLVAEFDSQIDIKVLPSIKGIKVDLIQGSILILALENSDKIETFARFCNHLSEITIGLEEKALVYKTISIIKEYSSVFSSSRSGMEKIVQIGMIGELHSIQEHILGCIGPELSIRAWIGPEGSKQDIVADDFCIEVKAHRKGFSDTITISSVEQLDSPFREKFYIYKIDLSPSESPQSISLNSLKQTIMISLDSNASAQEIFLDHFNELSKEATELQLEETFKVDAETVFEVNEGFPMLKSRDIDQSIVQDSISYQLDVTLLDEFKLAQSLTEVISNV
jgi:hypothetical protein